VVITFDGMEVGSVTTDPSGSFVATVKIPS